MLILLSAGLVITGCSGSTPHQGSSTTQTSSTAHSTISSTAGGVPAESARDKALVARLRSIPALAHRDDASLIVDAHKACEAILDPNMIVSEVKISVSRLFGGSPTDLLFGQKVVLAIGADYCAQ